MDFGDSGGFYVGNSGTQYPSLALYIRSPIGLTRAGKANFVWEM